MCLHLHLGQPQHIDVVCKPVSASLRFFFLQLKESAERKWTEDGFSMDR